MWFKSSVLSTPEMRSPVEKSSLRTVTLYDFLIAHWLERLTGAWKVVGSISAGGIGFERVIHVSE